ncbi:hypothetical protein EVAR_67244_1 [Eumeta japonica]|uniref:Uncharacterized protein n=1 Tax=Eumeta variegata TaxID=151549 RepID=A0A4C1YTH6_EUMVA|nr:hypothetical protein EVAR_67244_1 [Eumeta japonica]
MSIDRRIRYTTLKIMRRYGRGRHAPALPGGTRAMRAPNETAARRPPPAHARAAIIFGLPLTRRIVYTAQLDAREKLNF